MPRRFRSANEFTITYYNQDTGRINLRNSRFGKAMFGNVLQTDYHIWRGLRVTCVRTERNTYRQCYDHTLQYSRNEQNYEIHVLGDPIRVLNLCK